MFLRFSVIVLILSPGGWMGGWSDGWVDGWGGGLFKSDYKAKLSSIATAICQLELSLAIMKDKLGKSCAKLRLSGVS